MDDDNLWNETPLTKSEWLSSHIGSTVNIKLESVQPSGSFKVRGISQFMKQKFGLNDKIDTFVTTSPSNAGMAAAYTAMKLNCKCIMILDVTQREDNDLIDVFEQQYGAEVIYYGEEWNEADEYAEKLCAEKKNFCYVPIFDHPAIFDGNSAIVQELGCV